MRKSLLSWGALGVLALGVAVPHAHAESAPPKTAPAPAAATAPDPLALLCEKIQKNPEAADENDVRSMLELAHTSAHPLSASLAVKQYLAKHTSPSAQLLYAAAENAELAGDYRVAVTRYKSYLASPENAERASTAASRMYVLLIDFLHSEKEAYEFMRSADEKLVRQTPFARRFDVWFLEQARASGDAPSAAKRLVSIFSEKMPLEKERMLYWDYLAWVENDVLRPNPDKFAAAPHLTALAPLIRENKTHALRCALSAALLTFYVQTQGKEKEAQKPFFGPVAKAAQEYFDNNPVAATFRDIVNCFTAGDGNIWNMQLETKQALVIGMIEKLSDADRAEVIAPYSGHSTPEQWTALIVKNPAPFKATPQIRALNLLVQAPTPELYKKLGEVLQGVPSYSAAIINTINAGNLDMDAASAYILKNETWHANNPNEIMSWLRNNVWGTINSFAQVAKKPFAGDYNDRFYSRVGAELVASTPVAYSDLGQTGEYLRVSWYYSGKDANDHSKFAEVIRSLDWVPYSAQQRQQVFTPALNEFRRWSEEVKKDAKRLAENKAVMDEIEKALTLAMSDHKGDPKKAPNALCKALSGLGLAIQAKDKEAYTVAARELYAQVKEYNAAHTPWGKYIYDTILENRLEQFDTWDFQCEVLADQLTRSDTPAAQERIVEWSHRVTHRPNWQWWNWNWWQATQVDADKARKLRGIVEKTILEQADKGTLWTELVTLYRSTRQGPGWNDADSGHTVLEKLITTKTFFKSHYREEPWVKSDTSSYPWLIQREFQKQDAKFPVGTYFDDMYVEEETAAKYMDFSYFNFGRDEKKRIRNMAAGFFKDFERLPFGYSDKAPQYTQDEFWRWHYQILEAEPALRDAFIAQEETYYGKSRYDDFAAGRGYFSHQWRIENPETRKKFFERLGQFVEHIKDSGDRGGFSPERTMAGQLPPMHALSQMGGKFSKEELDALTGLFPQCVPLHWYGGYSYEWLLTATIEGLLEKKRENELMPIAGHLWKISLDTGNTDYQRKMAQYTVKFSEEKHTELATVFAIAGLEVMGEKLPEDARASLQAIRSKGLGALGHEIPVAANDPRYPIFFAQSEFQNGKQPSAWETYQANPALVTSSYKELDIGFLLWLLARNTDAGQFDRADALAHALIPWVEGSPAAFEPDARGRLMLYYGDISYARKNFPRARKDYERVTASKEYEGTLAQREAELRIAEVDRAVKDYDAALQRLDRLAKRHDVYLETEANYQMALVKFDQADYEGAQRYLEEVFAHTPEHEKGRLLEADVNLKREQPDKATNIKGGMTQEQKLLIPGTPLRVNLKDTNLSVVGNSSRIEVRVWTDSGDSETINLLPTDTKTQFEGEITTTMGPVKKDDHQLQVLGGDKVHYDYSEKFKEEHKIARNEPVTLEVASNSQLIVSSGKILTKEEQQDLEAERQIRQSLKGDDAQTTLSTTRAEDQIKPGNKINVRVIDFDRNISAEKDTVMVRATASSGDVIEAFPLVETDTHSGIFEGEIPTAPGHPMATASDSGEGREPNNVISSVDRPAWIAQSDGRRPKIFTVNLNDNVKMQSLNILADVPDRKLKAFAVETSMNGTDYSAVGIWPDQLAPWDGALTCELMKCPEGPARLQDAVSYADGGYQRTGAPKVTLPMKTFGISLDNQLNGNADKIKLTWQESTAWYLLHMHGAFYLPKRELKTFTLDNKKKFNEMRYFFAVDGVAAPANNALEIKRELAKGVHRVDVYVWSHRHTGVTFDVQTTSSEDGTPAVCSAEMFDPVKQPAIKEACWVEPAQVKAGAENTSFDVSFAKGAHARFLRLVIADYEKDAPGLHKLKLVDTENQTVLPTKDDFMALRENKTLEILPGDKITVTYRDPVVVTKGQEVQERFMTATFYNAKLSACLVEYVPTARGDKLPKYIPLRRFIPGDPGDPNHTGVNNVFVFINDPDEDTTDAPDKIKFRAVAGKSTLELEATETEPHSGVFVGNIYPVTGAPKRPNEITVGPDDDITIHYMDKENTDPGVPWDRMFVVEQSFSQAPKLAIFDVDPQALTPEELKVAKAADEMNRRVTEYVPITSKLVAHRPTQKADDKTPLPPSNLISDGPLVVELTYPALARSPISEATIYVQSASGREKAGKPIEPGSFDETVPGTLKLTRRPEAIHWRIEPPAGYQEVFIRDQRSNDELLSDGKFIFHIPLELAEVPAESLVGYVQPDNINAKPLTLSVRGNDSVFVGFKYTEAGATKWSVQEAHLKSEPRFHVMNNRYQEVLSGAHVGDNLYLRVIHKTMDTSNARNSVTVQFETRTGKKQSVTLAETLNHSGVFKGTIKLAYVGDKEGAQEAGTLPVDYGDSITATYVVEGAKEPLTSVLEVYKGSDGKVIPFTRRFKDMSLAVQTQFTIAESYFELAKQHRGLNQPEQARLEMAEGKKLLEEAIRDFPRDDSKVEAEYLLAELSLEVADDAADEDAKKKSYTEAQIRFSEIVSAYPTSTRAPLAQFKKALIYEKLGMMDQACEEYVKLSCRYPHDDLVCDTIARLGEYFRKKAEDFEKQSTAEQDAVKAEKLHRQAKDTYVTAGEVFSRLSVRNPAHRLALKTMLLSGHCYRLSEHWDKAIAQYKLVIDNTNKDRELIPAAMYYTGTCYMAKRDEKSDESAYHAFHNLIYEYAGTDWVKKAKGLMYEERMIEAEKRDQKNSH